MVHPIAYEERLMNAMRRTVLLACLACATLLGAEGKRLNSFVTEWANIAPPPPVVSRHEVALDTAGWLYLSATGGKNARARIDGTEVLKGRAETMRFLPAGKRVIELDLRQATGVERFVVRSVPEIFMYMLEYLEKGGGAMHYQHPKEFLDSALLRNCNVVVSHAKEAYAADAAAWQDRGGKWFANKGMGALRKADLDLAGYWRGILSRPMFDGSIHDEVLSQDPPHYERWGRAMAETLATPGLEKKRIYLWTPWGSLGNTDWGLFFQRDAVRPATGTVSLRCNASPDRLRSFRQVGLQLEPGQPYTLSCRMRVNAYAAKRVAGDGGYDGAHTGIFVINTGWFSTCRSLVKPDPKATDWVQVSQTFRPPKSRDGKYELLIVPPVHGTLWVDDLRLETGDKLGEGTDLLRNGGFETGWTAWNERDTKAQTLCRIVRENDCKLVIEAYMNERVTEAKARATIQSSLVARVASVKRSAPDMARHLTITFSAGNGPLRYSNDQFPHINYKTHLDLQFHAAANSPAFEGISGMGFWSLHYLDEEGARWYGALFRHYLIEGHRERLSDWPYELNHLVNPGFEDGMAGWQTTGKASAVSRQMAFGKRPRGTYSSVPEGKGLLKTVPAAGAANTFGQTVRNLKPGQAYVLKLFATDQQSSRLLLPATIELAGAEEVVSLAEQRLWTIRNGKTFWTMHKRIFRARAKEAMLRISDAPIGSLAKGPDAVFWDFVQFEPYFEK